MEFGGDVLVRPRMADVEGERGLVEVAPPAPRCRRPRGTSIAGRRRRPRAARPAICPRASRLRQTPSSGVNRLRLVVEPSEAGELGGARLQCGNQRAVVDIVAELLEADFLGRRSGPPARGSGGRCRRRAASPSAARRCPGNAARLRVDRADRRRRQAAPWCGCPHRARGGRAGRSSPRHRQAQSPP